MEPHIRHLDEIISPGLSSYTWSSLKINNFVTAVYDGLAQLELMIDRANQLTGITVVMVTHSYSLDLSYNI